MVLELWKAEELQLVKGVLMRCMNAIEFVWALATGDGIGGRYKATLGALQLYKNLWLMVMAMAMLELLGDGQASDKALRLTSVR
jgi:hypothetical protein